MGGNRSGIRWLDIETTLNERKRNCCCWAIPLRKVGDMRKLVSYKPGKQAMDDAGDRKLGKCRYLGDCMQNLFGVSVTETINRCTPEYVVIAIGINNLQSVRTQQDDTKKYHRRYGIGPQAVP